MIGLIGAPHFDLHKGYSRLRALLNYLEPDIVSMELCPERNARFEKEEFKLLSPIMYKKELKKYLEKYPESDVQTAEIVLRNAAFESRAVKDYAFLNAIPILFADKPKSAESLDKALKNDSEDDDIDSLWAGMQEILKLSPDYLAYFVETTYDYKSIMIPEELVSHMQERDEYTANMLLKEKGNIVHVAGIGHVFGDYKPNLYDKLKDEGADVVRFRLRSGDRFLK